MQRRTDCGGCLLESMVTEPKMRGTDGRRSLLRTALGLLVLLGLGRVEADTPSRWVVGLSGPSTKARQQQIVRALKVGLVQAGPRGRTLLVQPPAGRAMPALKTAQKTVPEIASLEPEIPFQAGGPIL